MSSRTLTATTLVLATACGEPGHDHNEEEVITTITLTFSPSGGGSDVVAVFDDPDGDGGNPPTIDPIALSAGTYGLAVGFENRLETPPEIITDEVRDEGDEHQVFFTGDAPLAHSYADQDARSLPIGLANTVVTSAGAGSFTVTLRHMPPLNDTPVKDGTAMAGMVDATATFAVTVQ